MVPQSHCYSYQRLMACLHSWYYRAQFHEISQDIKEIHSTSVLNLIVDLPGYWSRGSHCSSACCSLIWSGKDKSLLALRSGDTDCGLVWCTCQLSLDRWVDSALWELPSSWLSRCASLCLFPALQLRMSSPLLSWIVAVNSYTCVGKWVQASGGQCFFEQFVVFLWSLIEIIVCGDCKVKNDVPV